MAVGAQTDTKPNEHRGALPAGTRVRNYELMSVLGHGGFGITYYARDLTLGREVAVKEYLPSTLALRDGGSMVVPRTTQLAEDFVWGRGRFLEEARILATLEGVPSIVRVHDFLEANGTAYMVMGLARGDTLDQRLKRDGQLPPKVVEYVLSRLLDGLEEVHNAGFLHRDVKPANIILDIKSNPTLIDFGASRAAMADRTAAMTAIFTPRYAAAEQLTSDKQGPWTDIYSLSATLYHAITGRTAPSSLERALNDTYEPLSKISPPGFSFGTLRGVDAGMAVRAKDRPQSIAAWRHILSSTEAPVSDATMYTERPKSVPDVKTPDPGAPSADHSEPSPKSVAGESGPTSARKFASRVVGYAGATAAVLVLVSGTYLILGLKLGPSPSPDQEVAGDSGDGQARALAARQSAGKEAAQQNAKIDDRDARRLELDLAASRIELVDGRYVLRGEIINGSRTPASTTTLKLVFRKGDAIVGERTYSMVAGPVAPGGRLRFSRILDSPPDGTTQLVATVE